MVLKREPFVSTKLEAEKDNSRNIFTISLNKEEAELLEHLKRDLDIQSGGKALKQSMVVAVNVLHGSFGCKVLRMLTSKSRVRYSDYVDLGGVK